MNSPNPSSPRYLKLDLGKFYTVALKYPKPTTVRGFHGPELRWILLNGQAMYTPVDLEKSITVYKPGQRFEIGKFQNGRSVEWKIRPAQPEKQPAAALLDATASLDSPVEEIPRTTLEDALRTAVSAAAAAEKHASAIGYTVRFTPSDIRAMGISVLIGMDRRNAA
jgi:hypothetical protein